MVEIDTIRRSGDGISSDPDRKVAARRCLSGLCPRCGGPGLFNGDSTSPASMPRWGFRHAKECPYCGLRFQEESGVTLGTTVVGYVLVVLLVVVPLLIATAFDWIPSWIAITAGVIASFGLPVLLYPFLLRVTLATWFGFHPDAFNQPEEPNESPYS